MTTKQKDILNEMRKNNAISANVILSYKETPEDLIETFVKLEPYYTDRVEDVNMDDDYFFYFQNLDEMIDAMDASNRAFEFTIISILDYFSKPKARDKNGFLIKKNDSVLLYKEKDGYTDGWQVEEITDEGNILVKNTIRNTLEDACPSEVEILYDSINIHITDIKWDLSDCDGNVETEKLPSNDIINLAELVNTYCITNFSKNDDELSDAISDYLSDTYGYCHFGFNFEFDHEFLPENENNLPKTEETDSSVKRIDKIIEEIHEKIFKFVEVQKKKVLLFPSNESLPILKTNGDIEILQGLAIFCGTLCGYVNDPVYRTYDIKDEETIDEILEKEYWSQIPLSRTGSYCHVQIMYNLAKYLDIV